MAGCPRNFCSGFGRANIIILSTWLPQISCKAQPVSYSLSTLSLVVNWQRCEAGHPPPCSAKVNKNGTTFPLPPPMCLHGVHRVKRYLSIHIVHRSFIVVYLVFQICQCIQYRVWQTVSSSWTEAGKTDLQGQHSWMLIRLVHTQYLASAWRWCPSVHLRVIVVLLMETTFVGESWTS